MIKPLIDRVTKIALVVILTTISIVLLSWPLPIPDKLVETFVLLSLCVAVYLLGLLHANRVFSKNHDVNKEEKA